MTDIEPHTSGATDDPDVVRPDDQDSGLRAATSDHTESHMHPDSLGGLTINGWAWVPAEQHGSAEDRAPLSLSMGRTHLGHSTRRLNRHDVDDYVGDAAGAKGFQIPGVCLPILWLLLRRDPGLHPRVTLEGVEWSLYDANSSLDYRSHFRSLRCADGADGFKVEDLWWANGYLLKMRLDPASLHRSTRLRLFQPSLRPDGSMELRLADETFIRNDVGTVVALGALSPTMPLLLVGCDEDGEIRFTDLVPFPSLIRGGLHASEVSALGIEGGTLLDLRQLSDTYVAEITDEGVESAPLSLAEIAIDLHMASGAEAIFDPAIVLWLARGLGISLLPTGVEERRAADLDDDAFVEHAAKLLRYSAPRDPRKGPLRLTIPGHAVPTIATLVSRRLHSRRKRQLGSHIIVDEATHRRRWFVDFPPTLDAELSFALSQASRDAPFLTSRTESFDEVDGEPSTTALAIAFRDLGPKQTLQKLFPVSKDQPDILPHGLMSPGGPITVILHVAENKMKIDALVASISMQITDRGHHLIVMAAGYDPDELKTLRLTIERIMPPALVTLLPVDAGLSRSAALNRGAMVAEGEILVFIDNSVILHDHRTLETLAQLAALHGVGTVGCTVLSVTDTRNQSVTFKAAGYFPGRLDFATAPHLALAELDAAEALPNAVYPVAANGTSCFAIAREPWRSAGGFDDCRFPGLYAEVDLSVRLAEAGRTSLCTTLISTSSDATPRHKRTYDMQALMQLGFWRNANAMRRSTVLRTF